ncbi:LemA family protein [Halobacteria archaeon AArc-m2/3/4]|uniref:LemA family protein n=1 Tax=Natronoglomus mannanivorans TaxID=2979990 RepID=A0AAP3E200_9EURY|nr:LemA family protein [Halobacteria archaeon AArc-xg1-1]MCU4974620.1 LemA family protein [Halobacteria archaeon AArc-m2/3/4]
MLLILTIVVLFAIVLGGIIAVWYGINLYNSLIDLAERVDKHYADIDTSLQRRNDELDGVIAFAKKALDQEDMYVELARAREQASGAQTPGEQAAADQQVQQALMNFESRVEDYPDLDGTSEMFDQIESVKAIEADIQDKRTVYNDIVTRFNTRIKQFPHVVLAQQLGYEDKEHFEAEESARDAPDYEEKLGVAA